MYIPILFGPIQCHIFVHIYLLFFLPLVLLLVLEVLMVTPLEQVISSVAVVVQLPSVHLLVFWIVLHGPKYKSIRAKIIVNSFKLIINSIYLVLIWLTLHALFALMIPKKPTFVEIEITRLSFRLCTLEFRKSNDLNFIPKSLSTEQKGTDILARQITYSIVKLLTKPQKSKISICPTCFWVTN